MLNIAVTGHRAGLLTASHIRKLRPIVYTVFRHLRDAALAVRQTDLSSWSPPSQLRLHTALATGADQIAAICARPSGYFVRAVLPFEPFEYRKDFAAGEELDTFEQALAAADEIVALAGNRSDSYTAYVRVGELLVESADILIAIWDGEEGRGPGGTAHVVELALQRSIPVIHIDIDHDSDEVGMRALLDGNAPGPLGSSLHDTDLYSRVLRRAFSRADPAASKRELATASDQ